MSRNCSSSLLTKTQELFIFSKMFLHQAFAVHQTTAAAKPPPAVDLLQNGCRRRICVFC
ncbi:hypothetical protein A2U01_0083914 [Trifolium medium]|uniref:Uncharacterized protein n=1 Tax=Trifolium medium TaxID=97028 RepID=A0A392TQE9_9FABA|nr:hypothetical protein [Trifolium medium]